MGTGSAVWRWVETGALAGILGLGVLSGCGDDDSDGPGAEGQRDAAADHGKGDADVSDEPAPDPNDPAQRHQPDARLDEDNVTGDPSALRELELPPPPRSGFRIIVPPLELSPGEEQTGCYAWPYPEFTHRRVYAARIYTTGGLHHSNVYGVPLSKDGPSPYPDCGEGQGSVTGQLDNILAGDIMDVLFANSTQVVGREDLILPEGMAFELTTEGREITTGIHWLNTSEETVRVEVVYDLFTMPADEVEEELVPYYFDNFAFEVPARTAASVVNDCATFGGNLVTMMPHTHERARRVTVELMRGDEPEEILRTREFDLDSDITVFDEPISLADVDRIRHTCRISNDLESPIDYGIGTDEMCTLFGYMYPPSAQVMGVVQSGEECISLNIGDMR